MKDKDQILIFEKYNKKRLRDERIAYLCEDFGDQKGKNPFAKGDDDDSGADDSDDDSTEAESSTDDSSDSPADSKPKSKAPASSPSKPSTKPKDGKLSEEELDEELEILATKKSKIQKLFDGEDIDKEVAAEALAKLKVLTNSLVSQYI